MNSKNFAKFLQSLDVEKVETRKYYGFEASQDLLSLKLKKPCVFNVETIDCFFSCVSDCIELLSKERIVDFLVGGYLDRTVNITDINKIDIKEASVEKYEKICKKLEEDSFSY